MKARASSNTIAMLKDDNGNTLQKQTDIEKEIAKILSRFDGCSC